MTQLQQTPLDEIRRACHAAAGASSSLVSIDVEAAQRLGAALPALEVAAAQAPTRLPLRFDDLQKEVNCLALMHLLDCGRGYDALLRAAGSSGRGAAETAQFGVLGMAISGAAMDAAFLKEFSNFAVASYFAFDTHAERELMPGIMVSQPGPLAEYAGLLRAALNDTGRVLEEQGAPDLGAFVLRLLDERRASGSVAQAGALVDELAAFLPTFDDVAPGVPFQRKAQLLAQDLHLRFGTQHPDRFGFADAGRLTADSGPLLPAMLRKAGVLQPAEDLARKIDSGEELPAGSPEEVALRAAAVTAVDAIAAATGGTFGAAEVSRHLVHQAQKLQDSDPAALTPHVTRKTFAY